MVGIFVGVTGLLQVVYHLLRPMIWPILVYQANAKISAWCINLLTPAERAMAKGDIISAAGVSVQIAPGCDGIDAMILVTAALAAAPLARRHKLWGILAGLAVVWVGNLARTLTLFYTYKYRQDLFEPMHSYVGQTFIIMIGVLFFLGWVSYWMRDNETQNHS